MNKLKQIKVGDYLETITDYHSNGAYKVLKANVKLLEKENYAVMIRTLNFERNDFKDDLIYVTKQAYDFLEKSYVLPNDILMNKIANAGSVYIMPKLNKPVTCGMNLFLIRFKDSVNQRYMYYNMKNIERYIKKKSHGTTTTTLTKDEVRNINLFIHDKHEQDKIERFLTSIDKKIENNSKINKELEDIAKTIYDYWFLQFEFPNKEGKPYKSSDGKMVWNEKLKREIPEGWECVKLNEVFNFVKGKIPTETFYVSDDKHSIPYLTIDAVNNNNCEYCSEENMILTDGEVLMVMDGAASSEVYIGNKGAIGSTFCKLELKDKLVSNELLYLIMRKYESIFKKVNTGSTVPHANKNYINNFRICLPKDNMQLEKIQKHIIVNIKQINMRKRENKELVLLRDFLLPILMNGQVGFRELALAGD